MPTQVMLDSGASQTVVDARFLKTLKVEGTSNLTGQGAGGPAAYTVLKGVNLKLGAITFHDTASVGIDLSAVARQVGHDLPIVLGGDAFALCVVDVDFSRRRIAFRNPAGFTPPSGASSLVLANAGENFAVPANVEGRPASLIFDIGSASPLILFSEFWKNLRLENRPESTTKNGGLGGMHVNKLVTIGRVELAGGSFSDIPTTLEGEQKDAAADGIIGLPILRRFHLLVDLPDNRVVFAAPVDTKTLFDVNHTGLTLAPGPAEEKVLYVAPGSPAATAGLQAGDVIVTIDGMSISGWEAQAGLSSWICGVTGRQVRLGLRQGAAKSLVFGTYF